MSAPIRFQWEGAYMVPVGRFVAECERAFQVGEFYVLVEHEERSPDSHKHYFAAVKEAWSNLPADKAQRYPTPSHLRKWALIATGFRHEATFVASSRAEAVRLAAFLRPMDDTAVVILRDKVVVRLTAKSQDMRSMDRDEFQRSKQAVLDVLERELGIGTGELAQNAGRAA